MKPTTPHDPRNDAFDDLIAAALHGDLTPEERAQFESRLSSDPAAQSAYEEAQAMHDLLEKTHKNAQPDPDFEQRMVSGVRRKLAHPLHEETAWESVLFYWNGLKWLLNSRWKYAVGGTFTVLFLALVLAIHHDIGTLRVLGRNGIASPGPVEEFTRTYLPQSIYATLLPPPAQPAPQKIVTGWGRDRANILESENDQLKAKGLASSYLLAPIQNQRAGSGTITLGAANAYTGGFTANAGILSIHAMAPPNLSRNGYGAPVPTSVSNGQITVSTTSVYLPDNEEARKESSSSTPSAPAAPGPIAMNAPPPTEQAQAPGTTVTFSAPSAGNAPAQLARASRVINLIADQKTEKAPDKTMAPNQAAAWDGNWKIPASATAPEDSRKLIRNAQLDLEVKSYQGAVDQISALTKSAGGYVDTSNSQRGGNGKLQGTVVVKILPQSLDAFLLKLRDIGEVQNQSVSTEDVTKAYFDTQARLVNSQKMEQQLQELLKRENGKVSDLLAVERELGRVRGQIEEMQGQLKLYDFQVQYATVTMNLAEKDLNQAAAYLLKEQDDFALFATDVEATFQKARGAADDFKTQVLVANLQHNSGTDVSAELTVMVAPDQTEKFLATIRGLGRVANFTRQTQRVAKDGGDSSQPADETRTDKDKVQVHLSIRSDDDSHKQVALVVVTKQVGDALDQAKAAALAAAGAEILSSSLNTNPQGASTAQLSVRVPGKEYTTLMDAFRALGRQASLSVQRNDNSGPGASGDDAPVIVSLSLTDSDTPVQVTELLIAADDVDAQVQQIKKQVGDAGVEIKASSFQRQPDGSEQAQMTLRVPLGKYGAFLATLQKAGRTESLSVQRDDRPDQTRADDSAPAEINLQLHNQRAIVPDNSGLWATLRETFGEGFAALFGSVKTIGVLLAFIAPWVIAGVFFAWVGRRIYVWRKGR